MTTSLTSAGHVLSDESWLETHSDACAREYRDFVHRAGFRWGSRLLDAGSGCGSFVPWLREVIGPQARLTCVDLATENCRSCAQRFEGETDIAAASICALPFAAASFEAVWCANTTQYLSDADLLGALAEFRRVLRPGGGLAIKDVDMLAFKVSPADPFLFAHLAEACVKAPDASPASTGSLRGRELRRLMEEAGFRSVRQQSSFIERWAPLAEDDTKLWSDWLSFLAGLAREHELPAEDQDRWTEIALGEGIPFVSRPDFYACEAQVLAVGVAP